MAYSHSNTKSVAGCRASVKEMAITHTTTGPRPSTSAPCHPIISRQIDRILMLLDEETRPLQRKLLRWEKLIVELAIPPFYPNGGAQR